MRTPPCDLEPLLSPDAGPVPMTPGAGLVTGWFAGIDVLGRPLVHVANAESDLAPGAPPASAAVPALALTSAARDLGTARLGDRVLLGRIADSDPALVLLGLLASEVSVAARDAQTTSPREAGERQPAGEPAADPAIAIHLGRGRRAARLDGRTVIFEAQDEILLKCGRSSLTLRRNGEVVLRGVRILSRASQTQRIRGASVQIN